MKSAVLHTQLHLFTHLDHVMSSKGSMGINSISVLMTDEPINNQSIKMT